MIGAMRCSLFLLPDAEEPIEPLLVVLGEAGFYPCLSVLLLQESLLAEELPRALDRENVILLDPSRTACSLIARLPLVLTQACGGNALYQRPDRSFFLLVVGERAEWPELRHFTIPGGIGRFARRLYWFPDQPRALEESLPFLPPLQRYPSPGETRLWFSWAGPRDEAVRRLDEGEARMRQACPFAYLHTDTLAATVGNSLLAKGLRLAVAESCTGGLLSHLLTNTPGASDYFVQGWVVYRTETKSRLLGVAEELIAQAGVVSARIAEELAHYARAKAGTDLALSVTGLAGPGGGTAEVPVGTVYLGLAAAEGVRSYHLLLKGDRQSIKAQAAAWALYRLWRWLQREEHRISSE
jgi:PncC family amidohydrolase